MSTTEPPALGITGQELYDNTEPAQYAEQETGYAWARFLGALSELLDPVAIVTRPVTGEDSWVVLASPSRCPTEWLPVLAQWAGVRRPDAMTEEELRDLIGPTAPGMWRGTKAAMIAAVKRFYPPGTPPEAIYFEERADGDPYLLRIFTYETWEHDPELVQQALLHEKPAGINLQYEVRVGQTWGMLNGRMPSWGEVKAHYATWGDVKLDPPPGTELPPAGPSLTSVAPSSAVRLSVVTLVFTGVFPDDMTGFTATVDASGELVAAVPGAVTKVSDTECNATITMPHVGSEGVAAARILDAGGSDYANTVPITVTLA